MTPVADNPLRKAAVFIRSLQPDAAAAMLGRLSADEARALRQAISELGEVGEDERRLVAEDVRREPPQEEQPATANTGGVELQLSQSAAAAPATPAVATPPPAPAEPQPLDGAAWLASLEDADPVAIAEYLSREQPRSIAVVLGYLRPGLSARVLQQLPADERSRVVSQLAQQGDADPDSLQVIAGGLAAWIEKQQEEQRRRSSRVATIRQILSATPDSQRSELLQSLALTEPDVAAELLVEFAPPKPPTPEPAATAPAPRPAAPAAPPIAFDQLERLDPRALAEAVGMLPPRTALLALAGASERLLQRLTRGLPKQAASGLRARILRVGPTTLAEIDRAQEAFGEAAGRVVASRRAARVLQPAGA